MGQAGCADRRRRGRLLAAGCVLAGLAGTPAARAAGDESVQADTLGAMTFVFYHELGHALIDQLRLPAVGPEEDVVDEYASYMLIIAGQSDDRRMQALFAGADFWRASGELRRADATPFWDEHSFDTKRFYNIVCLLYGSDPGRFYPLMERFDIPQSRARRCEAEYRGKLQAWSTLLDPHLVQAGEAPAGRLRPVYQPAASRATDGIARLWQQSRFVEGLLDGPSSLFRLPRDIPVIAQDCGVANAFYSPGQGTITLCHELGLQIAHVLSGAAGAERAQDAAAAAAATAAAEQAKAASAARAREARGGLSLGGDALAEPSKARAGGGSENIGNALGN